MKALRLKRSREAGVTRAVPLLVLLAIGCSDGLGPEPGVDSDGDGIPDSADRCLGVAENFNGVFDGDGCPDTPTDLYLAVRADVEPFAAQVFGLLTGGFPYQPLRAFILFRGVAPSSCPGQQAFYCGRDLGVFLDEAFMLDQLQRIGDFAPAVIIAHEIGHHIQFQTGALSRFPSIVTELAADCFAGAWASTAGARGLLDAGDLQEAATTLFEVGDPLGTPWFNPGAHGSSQQRQQAFFAGFRLGVTAC
ncbi:MAG: neutral zinc metallopeptidase [Gemmatimonadota bacterium]